ncbi:MAG TPA: hypothetical protein DC000_04070 [Clostridiales bacterium]|nr:hypothetical protein [Clostridiales bacterium]
MKKVLSLVLAIMMVMSLMTTAFAGTFEDVTDETTAKAIDALMALGVVNGYADGTYKPEAVVTRAEMAKLIVEVLGNGHLADGSKASFKDAKGKWYEGYVAIASGLKIINGYPEGVFKGDSPVSYKEAVVMVLRALGYNDASVNGGVNSYNDTAYSATASKLGILKNVTFTAGGATRGDIAKMLYNALEAKTVEINDKNQAEFIVVGEKVDKESGRITKEYQILLDRKATKANIVVEPKMLDSDNKAYLGNLADLKPLMYQNVTVYKNNSGDVVFIKGSNSDTVSGTLKATKDNDGKITTNGKVVIDSKTYSIKLDTDSKIKVFYNGKEISATEAQLENNKTTVAGIKDLAGAKVTAIIGEDANGNDIITAFVADKPLTAIKVSGPYKTNSIVLGSIYLPKDGSKVDFDNLKVEGAATTLEDIQKNDIVYTYPAGGNTTIPSATTLFVVRDTVEGKVTKLDKANETVYIESVGYKEISSFSALTMDNFALKDEGTFYLDKNGNIFAFDTKSSATSDYLIVTAVNSGAYQGSSDKVTLKDPSIKVVDGLGNAKTYTVSLDAKLNGGAEGSAINATGNLYKVNVAEYAIVEITLDGNEVVAIKVTDTDLGKVDSDHRTVTFASGASVFNVYTDIVDSKVKFAVSSVEELEKNPVKANKWQYISNKNGDCVVVIVTEKLLSNSDFAVITGVESEIANDKVVQRVKGFLNGEAFEYLTSGKSTVESVDFDGVLYSFTIGNDTIKNSVEVNPRTTAKAITTGSAVTVHSNIRFTAVDKTTNAETKYTVVETTGFYVYKTNGAFERLGSISDLELINCVVEVYDVDGDNVAEAVMIKQQK